MQTLGLTRPELVAYHKALAATHLRGVDMAVLNLSGRLVKTIRPTVNSGQVDVDADAPVTRSCQLEFQDDSDALQFEPDSPAAGAVYYDNMVRLMWSIRVPGLEEPVECAAFTGPLTKFDRTAASVKVEAQGKESLALAGVPTMSIRKGANVIDTIERILRERTGEDLFGFPATRRRIPRAVVVSWEEATWPWNVCKALARSIGLQIFYDGAGVCRLRDIPDAAVIRFHSGEDTNLLAYPTESHDKAKVRNRVTVVGSKPSVTASYSLDDTAPNHPASPTHLMRNGVKLYLQGEPISDPKITTMTAVRARARELLRGYERMEFGTTVSAKTMPHLDELDMAIIETDRGFSVERLRQFSFAATGGGMSIGYNDVVSYPRQPVRVP